MVVAPSGTEWNLQSSNTAKMTRETGMNDDLLRLWSEMYQACHSVTDNWAESEWRILSGDGDAILRPRLAHYRQPIELDPGSQIEADSLAFNDGFIRLCLAAGLDYGSWRIGSASFNRFQWPYPDEL